MELKRIKCSPFVHAQGLAVSRSYVIGCSGRRAIILDRQYNLLQSVDGLYYVYSAKPSPDEKQLLLVSNSNQFYVTDLVSAMTRKLTVKAPTNCNLEGEGCWSHDGRYLYIPVKYGETMNSTLRRYRADDLTVDAEFLPGKYMIRQLQQMRRTEGYFMIGLDRGDQHYDFIQMKDDRFTVHPMEDSKHVVVFSSYIDEDAGEVWLQTTDGCRRYSMDGKLLEAISNPFATGANEYKDGITKYALSACGKYAFLSTRSGFYLMEASSKQLLCHIPEEFGVWNFEQLEDDVIALATWRGVKLYRLMDKS